MGGAILGYRIRIDEPGDEPRVVELMGASDVGRQADGVRVFDPTVSRRHVRLDVNQQGVVVTDLGSTYGTFYNGHRLASPVWMNEGDQLQLGNTTITMLGWVNEGSALDETLVPERVIGDAPLGSSGDGVAAISSRATLGAPSLLTPPPPTAAAPPAGTPPPPVAAAGHAGAPSAAVKAPSRGQAGPPRSSAQEPALRPPMTPLPPEISPPATPEVAVRGFTSQAFGLLAPWRGLQAGHLLVSVTAGAYLLLVPWAVQRVVDEAIPAHTFSQATGPVLVLAGAFLVSFVAGLAQAEIEGRLAASVAAQVRTRAAAAGRLGVATVADAAMVGEGVRLVLRSGVARLATMAFATIALVFIDPAVGLLGLALAPLAAVTTWLVARSAVRRMEDNAAATTNLLGGGHHRMPDPSAAVAAADTELEKAQHRLGALAGLFSWWANGFVTVGRIVMLAACAWMVTEFKLTTGAMLAAVWVVGSLLQPASGWGGLAHDLEPAAQALGRAESIVA